MTDSTIIYTHTDEAPALATYSFLPVVRAYAKTAGVAVESRDISLAGRIIAQFPERLAEEQRIDDVLAQLGELAQRPEANIIKLPNISASIPQLKAAVAELQEQGYALPDYPDEPKTDEEREIRARYDKVKGSAVNPVLREGNSDRRAPASVKNYARKNPHRMGAWSAESKTNVAHMDGDDFRSTEKSAVIAEDGALRIELKGDDGSTTVLRESVPVQAGEIVDAAVMRVAALREFLDRAGRPRQGRGRAVLRAPEGHHDEGLRPDHLRPRGPRVLPEDLRRPRRGAGRRRPDPERRPGRHPQGHRVAAGRRRDQGVLRGGAGRGPGPGHGRLAPRHHQPARAQRRHRRRVHAGDDPHLGPHVEQGRRRAGRAGRHPGQQLRADLPGRHRRLPRARRLRPVDDGLGAQRRPDGAEGRGVRQPRQDLRGPHDRHRARRRRPRARPSWSRRSAPATSSACARPRTSRSRTG